MVTDKTETLPGAGVYISGYKIATVSDNDGKFFIPNLRPGSYDILVQMMGYLPLSKNIVITDKSVVVELKLIENKQMLREVVIKPNPNRPFYVDLFTEFFIGRTPNADRCKILNTDALLIDEDIQNRTVTIKASDFLVIENRALGYRIKYLLEQFEYNFATKNLFYAGYPTFEEIKGSNSEQKGWLKNREVAYRGSAQHFFAALYQNNIDEEGFIINKRYEAPNPKRLPDSVIKKLSFPELLKQEKEPKILTLLDNAKVPVDTLVKKFNNSLKMISFKDELFVSYKNEQELPAYVNSSYYQHRPKALENYQLSTIKMLRSPILFYANGMVADPNSTLFSGYWSYEKMADAVPIDYLTEGKKAY
ncbi:MAG: carboxypeptidase-like regulatory domain-containing protein [Bacteroidota bacterium]